MCTTHLHAVHPLNGQPTTRRQKDVLEFNDRLLSHHGLHDLRQHLHRDRATQKPEIAQNNRQQRLHQPDRQHSHDYRPVLPHELPVPRPVAHVHQLGAVLRAAAQLHLHAAGVRVLQRARRDVGHQGRQRLDDGSRLGAREERRQCRRARDAVGAAGHRLRV